MNGFTSRARDESKAPRRNKVCNLAAVAGCDARASQIVQLISARALTPFQELGWQSAPLKELISIQ
jgi:hypothetical protein